MNYIKADWMPQALERALTLSNDTYHAEVAEYFATIKKDYDYAISVTTLPSAPQPRILAHRHSSSLWGDPVDNLWTMKGSMIHAIIEQNARSGDITEKRIGVTVPLTLCDGVTKVRIHFHGQLDLFEPDTSTIWDFKYVSPRSMLYGDKEEHTFQLNALRLLFKIAYGIEAKHIKNCFVMKDWAKMEYIKSKDRGYPERQIVVKEREIADQASLKMYMATNAKLHYASREMGDEELPACTPEQQWRREATWKVYTRTKGTKSKPGHMSVIAKKTCSSESKALEWLEEKGVKKDNYIIKHLKSRPTKCEDWCEVSGICHQRRKELKEEQEENETTTVN